VSDNNCTMTKSRGAIGSKVQALLCYLWYRQYNGYEAEGEGILHTVLLILEMILLKAFSLKVKIISTSKVVVVMVGRSSPVFGSSSGRRIFRGNGSTSSRSSSSCR
jgi:hypothetical protein